MAIDGSDAPRPMAGRVALVTGASRGIGAATAIALAAEGCAVACAARSTLDSPQRTPGTLDETVEQIRAAGGEALAVPTDLAVADEVVAMVERTVEHFGALDHLINNAAVTFVGDLDIPLRRYELLMAVNLTAPLVAMREAAPHLRASAHGAIVNVSSVAALYPYPGLMAYGMSKAALERATVDVARQLRPDGVAVNVFRVDVAVASEGFVANAPGADHSSWEPSSVAAEGIVWLLGQPADVSGQLLSMFELREQHGIMPSRAAAPAPQTRPPTRMATGLVEPTFDGVFEEPYADD
jgi:NAD(P)-dependent dehydrogenase (short-subunit alcohol dehydrogenase family)